MEWKWKRLSYKEYQEKEPLIFRYEILGNNPRWGFVLAVKGAGTLNPIRGFNGTSADDDSDIIFPMHMLIKVIYYY